MKTPYLDKMIDDLQNHIESIEAGTHAGIPETRAELKELEATKTKLKNHGDIGDVRNCPHCDEPMETTKESNTSNPNMDDHTILYAGFPAVGKSYFCKHSDLTVLDSDSSKFDKAFFPQNYIDHIKANLGKVDVILISSHDVVREALVDAEILFTLVYPNIALKEEYIQRYKERGSPEGFIKLVGDNWESWITQLHQQSGCKKIELSAGQYLKDVACL